MKQLLDDFPISNSEYQELSDKFSKLCTYASWQLLRRNTKNNHTDEFEDINQELIMSLIRAGSYHKRQVYIEKCFDIAKKHVNDIFVLRILNELENLWKNKTRHGAGKRKFGLPQEEFLYKIVKWFVPSKKRPDKNSPLEIDETFTRYCKAICWNAQRSLGRKITKEKGLRTGVISLGSFEYLAEEEL